MRFVVSLIIPLLLLTLFGTITKELHGSRWISPCVAAVQAPGSAKPRTFDTNTIPVTRRSNSPSTTWAALIARLLRLSEYVIPTGLKQDFDRISTLVGFDSWEFNVKRELVLQNVSLGFKGQPMMARIGRICIAWDSYTQPCLNIEVMDLQVWVDFLNLQLSRTNWHEIFSEGFLPDLSKYYYGKDDGGSNKDPVSTLTFHGINLIGRGIVHVHSRPLTRKLGTISLDMKMEELNRAINKQSQLNMKRTGRKGCTATEIQRIVELYATETLKTFVARLLSDVATQPDSTIDAAERMIQVASDSILGYARDAGESAGEQIQKAMLSKIEDLSTTAATKLTKFGEILQKAADSLDPNSKTEHAKSDPHNRGAGNEPEL